MNRPNIIVVILDTVRAANLSCYGYHRSTTPNLDRFSEEGNLFTNAFTPAIWTVPSHASMFTGTYPSTHGALNLHRYLDPAYQTLAEVLGSQGYSTLCFSNNFFLSLPQFGLGRGFDTTAGYRYPESFLSRNTLRVLQWLTGYKDNGAWVTNRFAGKVISSAAASRQPLFMVLNYMEAHAPYKKFPGNFLKRYLTASEIREFKSIDQDRQKYLTGTATITEEQFSILRSVYDAQIFYLDVMIDRLVKMLKVGGTYDNTMVIITSDHGDLIGEHGLVHHSYAVYEELIKVPLLIKMPGSQDNGTTRDKLISLIDLFPTILDAAGENDCSARDQAQGLNVFLDRTLEDEEAVFIECERPKNEFAETYPDFDFSVYDRELRAIRTKENKLIWSSDGRHELYDLTRDPSERDNLFGQDNETAHRLKARLSMWYSSLDKHKGSSNAISEDMDESVKSHLRALGYF